MTVLMSPIRFVWSGLCSRAAVAGMPGRLARRNRTRAPRSRCGGAGAGRRRPRPVSSRHGFERKLLEIEEAGGFGVARGFVVSLGDIKRGSGIVTGSGVRKSLHERRRVRRQRRRSRFANAKIGQVSLQSPQFSASARDFGHAPAGRTRRTVRFSWRSHPESPVRTRPTTRNQDRGQRRRGLQTGAPAAIRAGAGPAALRHGRVATRRIAAYRLLRRSARRRGRSALRSQLAPLPRSIRATATATAAMAACSARRLHDFRQQNDGPYSFRRLDGAAEQYCRSCTGNWVLYLRGAGVHDDD